MGVCSYCKEERKLSREHIIPAFLSRIQKKDGDLISWNGAANKLLSGEAQIKDVCGPCNNERLGELDGYAKQTLEKAKVLRENFTSTGFRISCDTEKLSRWVLKLVFNSARATGNQPEFFYGFESFILSGEQRPTNFQFFGGLHKPVVLTREQIREYKDTLHFDKSGRCNPLFVRVVTSPTNNSKYIVRTVVIGALLLSVAVFHPNVKKGFQSAKVRKVCKKHGGMQPIDLDISILTISQIEFTALDTLKSHFSQLESMGLGSNTT